MNQLSEDQTPSSESLAIAPAAGDTNAATSPLKAAVAGVLSAGAALGIGQLLAGASESIPSLVVRVGDAVIERVPASIERWAIETLGTGDKPALVWGIVSICLLIGAVTGIAASSRSRTKWLVYGVFGLVGGLAAASDPQRPAAMGWFVAVVAALTGITVLSLLLARAAASAASPVAPDCSSDPIERPNRRGFVAAATAAAAFGVGAPLIGSQLRGRRAQETEQDRDVVAADIEQIDESALTQQRELVNVGNNFDDIGGITPLVVPNDEFYRIDTALVVPQIDVDTWSMKITGMVDNEVEFTFDDLLAMDLVEETVTMSCVSNPVGGDLVGNAVWLGVPLVDLLAKAGVQLGAEQIVGRSVDGWTGGFPTEYLDDPDRTALVVVAMNGEPLPVQHGFPVRLVISGLYGYVSATKWLKEIELTTWDFDGYWITRGWSKLGPVKTQSRIDVPRTNARLKPGDQMIAGIAWAPDRGIRRVEVQVAKVIDNEPVLGPWIEADLTDDVSDNSWRQWSVPWQAPAGDHVVRVRATDGTGTTQTEVRTNVAPDGASGWHTIAVRVD